MDNNPAEGNICLAKRHSAQPVSTGLPNDAVSYIGSGMVVGPANERYYVVTLDIMLYALKKSSPNLPTNDLVLHSIEIAFADAMPHAFTAQCEASIKVLLTML
jgi:hypothetical protein